MFNGLRNLKLNDNFWLFSTDTFLLVWIKILHKNNIEIENGMLKIQFLTKDSNWSHTKVTWHTLIYCAI